MADSDTPASVEMRIPKPLLLLLLLAAPVLPLLAPTTVSAADPTEVNHLAHLLRTPDACGMSVADCAGFGDSIAIDMRNAISGQLDQGKSESQILDWFQARYGEEVLMAPRKEGFGLAAYLVPFAAGVLFAVVLGLPLTRFWFRRRQRQAAAVSPPPAPPESRYRERVEQDLRRLE